MYYKVSILILLIAVLIYKFENISQFELFYPKLTFVMPYIGISLCFALSALGTYKGMLSIGNAVSGGSIVVPRIGSKSIIGTVFIEANLIVGVIVSFLLLNDIPDHRKFIDDKKMAYDAICYLIFTVGFVVGVCSYCSSVSTGIICGAICLKDAVDPMLFSKLVAMELISSSLGPLGLVLGFVIKSKYTTLQPSREK